MNNNDKSDRIIRCRHCGGPMRLYREDINCLMCGRTLEHSCERCKHAEEPVAELAEKKVA